MKNIRFRYAIGEILEGPASWPDSYWFVKEHGPDYFCRTVKYGYSTEILQHYPTGVLSKPTPISRLRLHKYPNLMMSQNSIYHSVTSHWHDIFTRKINGKSRNYKGMPFQKEWNPKFEGSFIRAVWEIKNDVGLKPAPNYQLSVINHSLGFIRGNLMWIPLFKNALERDIRMAKRQGFSNFEIKKAIYDIFQILEGTK